VKRDPILYLDDMLTYARAAHEFVQGMRAEAFKRDTRTQYAIAYALHIVGEAARNVPAEMRQRYPQIPWQEIIGCATASPTTTWAPVTTSFLQRRSGSPRS